MDASVKPAFPNFLQAVRETFESTTLVRVLIAPNEKGEGIASQNMGEHLGGGSREATVGGDVFGVGRCFDQWFPVRLGELGGGGELFSQADGVDGSPHMMAVLAFPGHDPGIGQRQVEQGEQAGFVVQVHLLGPGCELRNVVPVAGRSLGVAEIFPEFGEKALFGGSQLAVFSAYFLYFAQGLDKFLRIMGRRRRRKEWFQVGNPEGFDFAPMRLLGRFEEIGGSSPFSGSGPGEVGNGGGRAILLSSFQVGTGYPGSEEEGFPDDGIGVLFEPFGCNLIELSQVGGVKAGSELPAATVDDPVPVPFGQPSRFVGGIGLVSFFNQVEGVVGAQRQKSKVSNSQVGGDRFGTHPFHEKTSPS